MIISTNQRNITESSPKGEQLAIKTALDIVKADPSLPIDKIIEFTHERLRDTAFSEQVVEEEVEKYRAELQKNTQVLEIADKLSQTVLTAGNRAFGRGGRLGLIKEISSSSEYSFINLVEADFKKNAQIIQTDLERFGDNAEILVGLADLISLKNKSSDLDEMERLAPRVLVINRPTKMINGVLVKSHDFNEILEANPDLRVDNITSIYNYLLDEKLRELWDKKENEKDQENRESFDLIGVQEYAKFTRDSSLDTQIRRLVKQHQEKLKEIMELKEKLHQDYLENLAAFLHFGFRKPDPLDSNKEIFTSLIQRDLERPGQYYYLADYDGSLEAKPAKNFTGERFDMPTLAECFQSFTLNQAKQYQEMQKAGKEPKLRLTPLGYKTNTLAAAIDSRMKGTGKGEIAILTEETFLIDIIDHELVYEPEDIEAVNDDTEVKITGGKALSELIIQNSGWKIEFLENVRPLGEDSDKIFDTRKTIDIETQEYPEYTMAKKQELYFRDAKSKGQTGLSYKTALAAQMCNLLEKIPNPFDKYNKNILSESCLTDSELVPNAYWYNGHVTLFSFIGSGYDDLCCFRRSVPVKRFSI